jgi:hypothetical protein
MTRLGINLPWVKCGHDFGPRPPAWGGESATPRDWTQVEEELRRYAGAGMTLTRFWVLAGGVNYPVGEGAERYATVATRRRSGRLRSHRALALLPETTRPSLPASFVDDFAALLRTCARAGVRAVPSLVSFELFQPLVSLPKRMSKRGRGDLVFGSEHGRDVAPFLDAVLGPLLDAAQAERGGVYAFEVINEPGWAVRGGPLQIDRPAYGLLPSPKLVSAEQMGALIAEGVERIVARDLTATVGFVDPAPRWLSPRVMSRLAALAGEGRYVHQRHHYPTVLGDHTLPHHDESPITPCILGELPTAMGGAIDNIRWRDSEVRATERDPSRYLEARLRLIHEARSYPASLLWSARSGDGRRSWGEAQLQQVRRYARALGLSPAG